jgi:cellulose synthase (UDP-forming)
VAGPRAATTTLPRRGPAPPPPSPKRDHDRGESRSIGVLSRAQRTGHLALGLLWVVVNVQFWSWWLPRAADGDRWLALAVSVALAYQVSVLPTIFWWFVGQMRRPVRRRPPRDMRVAMVTLCVPSYESLDVIEAQLRALRDVRYPHESWILDEENSPEVRALALRYGVRHFSRRGIERWNQPGPPHQRKTKAGNVNAWLSFISETGIDYDVFVQLDIDHQPDRRYLDLVLGYFDDPQVAWVQAPSVCGNLDVWTARGLAEQDLVMQGPLQMGFYGSTRTPFIIGSHTSYRTAAIREIGGFQPTRAEDHLDTVVLTAHGYRGVYLPETIARGDGPVSFVTYLRQQYAWAHSMITVLFTWTPRMLRRYTLSQALQFLFSQTWYVGWSVSMLVLWAAPLIALVGGWRIASAGLAEYLLYFAPQALGGWLMWSFARPWFKPEGVRISWRGAVLTVARWPIVLWALIGVLLRVKRPYMITPKGTSAADPRGAIIAHGPLLGFATAALGGIWISSTIAGGTGAYVLLVLVNAMIMLVASGTVLLLDTPRTAASSRVLGVPFPAPAAAFAWLFALAAAFAATLFVYWDAVRAAVA